MSVSPNIRNVSTCTNYEWFLFLFSVRLPKMEKIWVPHHRKVRLEKNLPIYTWTQMKTTTINFSNSTQHWTKLPKLIKSDLITGFALDVFHFWGIAFSRLIRQENRLNQRFRLVADLMFTKESIFVSYGVKPDASFDVEWPLYQYNT